MSNKRVTIYDLAKELGISASYISKALNDHPSISEKVRNNVKRKAVELNYRHNSHAANLRQGRTKTIGVIVPHINQSFFSEAIAGMEEACFANNHSLIICQSHESFEQECKAINTLIHQNVDCILISVSAQTKLPNHLRTVQKNEIELIQFDRYIDDLDCYKVLNDNEEVAYKVVQNLINEGYKKIGFLGGPPHLTTFKSRKDGYLKAIKENKLVIPYNFIVDDVLDPVKTAEIVTELLTLPEPPDALLTVSDHQSLTVLQIAESLGVAVPFQLGIFGFANEDFTQIIKPTLSSVDQKSKELGRRAADLYFESILNNSTTLSVAKTKIVKSEIIKRQSSNRTYITV
jgi:DNA-binding LacI/PurR family transcriptional regulator